MTTWIKVYNSMPAHPKFLMAGDRAAWLFVCGCCYANEHLTDGFIAAHVLPVAAPGVKSPEVLAVRLVAAGLWHEVDGGWQIHDYSEHQRSAGEIRERRDKDAKRQADKRAVSNGSPHGQNSDTAPESARNPSGVQPLEESREEETPTEQAQQVARKRASRRVDQTKPPEDFPADKFATLTAVLPILHQAWEIRGGVEPRVRGVAMGMQRKLTADHEAVARRLCHWLLAGKGQRANCGDIAARFGDWVAEEIARPQAAGRGNPTSDLDERRLESMNRLMAERGAA